MHATRRVYRITLATADAPAFVDACHGSDWRAVDTGERIMTDEGPDGETVLLVEPHALAAPRAAALVAQ